MNKNKTTKIMVCSFLLFLLFTISCSSNLTTELSLDGFLQKGEYQFGTLAWGSPPNSVAKNLSIIKLKSENPSRQCYKVDNRYILDDNFPVMELEFFDQKLGCVTFTFLIENGYEEWFTKQLDSLSQIYGKPNEQAKSMLEQVQAENYRWISGDTQMHLSKTILSKNGAKVGLGFISTQVIHEFGDVHPEL